MSFIDWAECGNVKAARLHCRTIEYAGREMSTIDLAGSGNHLSLNFYY